MANTGKASREVVSNLISDIDTFVEIVTDEINDIKRDAVSLSSDWDDKQYQDFLAYVEGLTSQLSMNIRQLEQVNSNLRKALEKY
jgi:hypothetical protein